MTTQTQTRRNIHVEQDCSTGQWLVVSYHRRGFDTLRRCDDEGEAHKIAQDVVEARRVTAAGAE